MDFRDTPEEAAFRQEVREFLDKELPQGFGTPDFWGELMAERSSSSRSAERGGDAQTRQGASPFEGFYRQWVKKLAAKGWVAPAWPKEYGGAGMSVMQQFIMNEEFAMRRAPRAGGIGVAYAGPTIIVYGSEEQKREHLPGILSGDVIWCQLYSEPGAGSDLAGLQTRATKDGDDYIINGQKIWTSGAHRAHRGILLARTDPDAPKHRGISYFLLDMKTPGITIQPLVNMAGTHEFNQVFFDNVRVPKKDLLGEENRGWYMATTTLDFERSSIGSAIGQVQMVEDLMQFAREHRQNGHSLLENKLVRLELVDRYIEAEVARHISYRVITLQNRGLIPNYEASMAKLYSTELTQRIARTGIHLIGHYGVLDRGSKWAPLRGRLGRMYLMSVSATIAGGTSEIQRNIIATRGLGLPRG